MNPLIKRFESWLEKNNPELLELLNPGVEEVDLDRLESRLKVELPPLLKELYLWRDGFDDTHGFYGEFQLLPLEEILDLWEQRYSSYLAQAKTDQEAFLPGEQGWVPFLYCDGVSVCLDYSQSAQGSLPVVIDEDAPYFIEEAPSFEAWFETYVESLEAGNWEFNEKAEGWYPKEFKRGSPEEEAWGDFHLRFLASKLPGYPRIIQRE